MKIQPGLEALKPTLAILFWLVPNTKEPFQMIATSSVKDMFIRIQTDRTLPFWL